MRDHSSLTDRRADRRETDPRAIETVRDKVVLNVITVPDRVVRIETVSLRTEITVTTEADEAKAVRTLIRVKAVCRDVLPMDKMTVITRAKARALAAARILAVVSIRILMIRTAMKEEADVTTAVPVHATTRRVLAVTQHL